MVPVTPFSIACKTDVRFGAGVHKHLTNHLPHGVQSVLLVKGVSERASAPVLRCLLDAGVRVQTVICPAEPSVASVNAIWHDVRKDPPDCIVVCGGGSAIDTGKALRIALRKGAALCDDDFTPSHSGVCAIPLVVLPTTAGTGAEVTANAVLGAETRQAKVSLRGDAVAPTVAIVDPDLMRGAPRHVVLYAGLDAVVQNIEAYTSAVSTPFSRALAVSAVDSTLAALRQVMSDDTPEAWSHLAWGSLCSGLALANGGLGAVHGLASILGGAYAAPHGALCGQLLVPVMRANLAATAGQGDVHDRIAACQSTLAELFPSADARDPLAGFERWTAAQGLPRFAHWGVDEADIPALAEAAIRASSTRKNPVALDAQALAQVLHDAL